MDSTDSPAYVVPNPQIPKTIGILNIVFAALLLMNGLLAGVMFAVMPFVIRGMHVMEERVKSQVEKRWQDQIDDFARREAAAPTEAEKATIRTQRANFEAVPKPIMPSMTMGFRTFEDRRVMAYLWTDTATGLILNTVMLVAGLRLVKLMESGRKLALWGAGLKLARLAILLTISIVFIMPIQQTLLKKQMAEMETFQRSMAPGGRMPGISPTRIMQMSASISGVLVIFGAALAAAYPVVAIVLLTRPRARAACLALPQPERGPT